MVVQAVHPKGEKRNVLREEGASVVKESGAKIEAEPVRQLTPVEIMHPCRPGRVRVSRLDAGLSRRDSIKAKKDRIEATNDAIADAEEEMKRSRNDTRRMEK